jgi:hypothetical protein
MDYKFNLTYETDWQCFELMLAILQNGKPFDSLDNRERQILACIYAGMDAVAICDQLGIKEGHYNVKLTALKKKKIIDENIKPQYPMAKPSSLLFTFQRTGDKDATSTE